MNSLQIFICLYTYSPGLLQSSIQTTAARTKRDVRHFVKFLMFGSQHL